MARLTMIVGLPGSGKSHLSDELAEQRKSRVYHDVLGRHLIPDESEGYCSLLRALQAGEDCVANEICLAHRDKREAFEKMMGVLFGATVQVDWIFFENDPAQCRANVDADDVKPDKQGRLDAIAHYSAAYDIPAAAEVWPVHRP